MQVVAPRDGQAERLQQLRGLGLLEHVAAGPRAQRLARVLGVLAHRQDRHREGRMRDEARGQRPEARAAGHGEVEREQVGLVLADFTDHRRDVGGFGDHPELARLALEHGTHTVADDRVVVGDDHVDRAAHAWRAIVHLADTVAPGQDRTALYGPVYGGMQRGPSASAVVPGGPRARAERSSAGDPSRRAHPLA